MPTPPPDFGTPLLSWEAPIQVAVHRSARWYGIAGAIMGVTCVYALWTGAWSLVLVTLLCGLVYWLQRDHEPVARRFDVYEHGCVFDGRYATWAEFSGFWFLRLPSGTQLHLERRDGTRGVTLLVMDVHPDTVKQVLAAVLPEDTKKTEHLFDLLCRLFKL
jgi:hypothetical protein